MNWWEETTLVADELTYLFQFNGCNTLHHVFFADIAHHASVQPSNEIAKGRRFAPVKIATLSTSIPTRGIVELLFRYIRALEPEAVQQISQQAERVSP